jgi:hypothetical protein
MERDDSIIQAQQIDNPLDNAVQRFPLVREQAPFKRASVLFALTRCDV